MGSKQTKVLILIGLLAVWGLMYGFGTTWQSPTTAPAPGPVAAPSRTPAGPGGDLLRLKTELLDRPLPPYVPETQSIFGTPPPPPPPPRPVVAAPPPAVPLPPPPDPFQEEAKRLRYVGFLRRPDRSVAFIIQGQTINTLEIGETLAGRFRVQSITEDAVMLTSPNGDKQVRIPLVATTGPTAVPR